MGISPFNSPLVSPLKNRFRVSRVQESMTSSNPTSTTEVSVSYTHVIGSSNQMGTSVPDPSLHSRSLSVGDLGARTCNNTAATLRPNRFSTGSRFTVTRVMEQSNVPLCSSLPATYINSSPIKAPIKNTATKTSESNT